MFICTKCKKEYSGPISFCGECGGVVEEKGVFCLKCMLRYDGNIKFCHSCGSKLEVCSGQKILNIQKERAEKACRIQNMLDNMMYDSVNMEPRYGRSTASLDNEALAQGVFKVNAKIVPSSIIGPSLYYSSVNFQLVSDNRGNLVIDPQSVVCDSDNIRGQSMLIYLFVSAVLCPAIVLFIIAMYCDKPKTIEKTNEWLVDFNNILAKFNLDEINNKIGSGFVAE